MSELSAFAVYSESRKEPKESPRKLKRAKKKTGPANKKINLENVKSHTKTSSLLSSRKRKNVDNGPDKKNKLIKGVSTAIKRKKKNKTQKVGSTFSKSNNYIHENDGKVPISNRKVSKEVPQLLEYKGLNSIATAKEKLRKEHLPPTVQISNYLNTSECELVEDTFQVSENLLKFLLAPIKPGDFFEKFWEKQPMHIVRNKRDYFKNLFTSEKLDKILRENPMYYTRNVDVVTYENGQRQTHNPDGRAIPASVWDYYSNGCSVRILNPQTYCQKLRHLLTTLQEYFGTMVGVNVYLTPSESQGFAPHYDDIEAFVLQLEGRKHWKIYAPRTESEVLPRHSSHNFCKEQLDNPIKELTVEAGDLLYFPRGFIHEACTDSEAHSLHITVSVYQNTAYIDLLERLLPEALKMAVKDDVEFRQGLPLNYLKHLGAVNMNDSSNVRNEVSLKVQDLIRKLTKYAPLDWAADQMGRKFMYDALPPVLSSDEKDRSCKNDGDMLINGVVHNRIEFGLDTLVKLVRYHCMRLLVENETTARIYYCTENANVYHGEEEQSLEMELSSTSIVEALVHNYPNYISIESLPGQNEIEKIQVISDLWERGLIITKNLLVVDDD